MSKILRVLEGTPACENYLEVKWLMGSWGWSLLGRRLGWTVGLLRNKHDRRWTMGRRVISPQVNRWALEDKDGVSGPGQHSVSCSVSSGLIISLALHCKEPIAFHVDSTDMPLLVPSSHPQAPKGSVTHQTVISSSSSKLDSPFPTSSNQP